MRRITPGAALSNNNIWTRWTLSPAALSHDTLDVCFWMRCLCFDAQHAAVELRSVIDQVGAWCLTLDRHLRITHCLLHQRQTG